MDAEKIIKGVDGGRALHARSFRNLQHRAREALLKTPTDPDALMTRSTGQSSVTQIMCFSTEDESSAFFDAVRKDGWGVAGSMGARISMVKVSANISGSRHATRKEAEFMEAMVTQTWIVQSIYVPMGSFQIPRNHMRISDAAIARIRNIKRTNDAHDFLDRFGSHVSSNRYVLGGFFFEQVCASTNTAASRKSLKDSAITRKLFSGTVSVPFGAGADACVATRTQNESRHGSSSSTFHYEKHIKCMGPVNVTTGEEFRRKLDEDASCWAIVDKDADRAEDLVSVWDIIVDSIKDHGSRWAIEDRRVLLNAAKLLCNTWIDQVQGTVASNESGDQDGLGQRLTESVLKREVEELRSIKRSLQQLVTDNQPTAIYHLPQPAAGIDEPIISPQPKWGPCPITELNDRLRALVQEDQSSATNVYEESLVDKVSILLKSCIRYLSKNAPHDGPAPQDLEEQRGKIVEMVARYSFREDGTYSGASTLDIGQVASMVEDLEDRMGGRDSASDLKTLARDHREWDTRRVVGILAEDQSMLRYVGTVLVDKQREEVITKGSKNNDRQILLVDNLQCHLEAFSRVNTSRPRQRHRHNAPRHDEGTATSAAVISWCPFQDLVELMHASDFGTQVAVSRFLLQQRMAAPLIAPAKNGGRKAYLHWAEALSFVEVKLLDEKACYVGLDGLLPRVAFLSQVDVGNIATPRAVSRSPVVATDVCGCTFPSKYINPRYSTSDHAAGSGARFPVVEVGIGFIEDVPFMALHVNGRYDGVLDFVASAADIVVLEVVEPIADLDSFFPGSWREMKKAQWRISVDDECDGGERMLIAGTESFVVQEIRELVHEDMQELMSQPQRRAGLVKLCNNAASTMMGKGFRTSRPLDCLERALREEEGGGCCDTTMPEGSTDLQSSYEREAKKFFEQLKLSDAGKKTMAQKEGEKEKKWRRQQVGRSMENRLLRMFYRIVSQQDAGTRAMGLLWFQRALARQQKRRGSSSSSSWSKQQSASLGMVHLWRELCHIFVAFPQSQGGLPKLAAQHLMDGYPMEILDGDAAMFCGLWVTSILKELQALTRKSLGRDARIFVLSAMGVQSSGKSTLLNLMFGAQLMTSAGRCTRGVFIQLVPSAGTRRDRCYDFVLIVDTEGLRSPDFPIGAVHDNRLATFGLLPADASIFLISNEDDSGLKEVLPMVLLGFKGSAMAESSGGRIKTKLFFVYRSVDVNDKRKLNQHKQKLKRHLQEAADEVSNMSASRSAPRYAPDPEVLVHRRHDEPREDDLGRMLFDDLHIDDDDRKSDVRCMGNLKKGSKPPEDVPDWEYGKEVSELREYIHRRITADSSWAPSSIQQWSDNLTRVWDCICASDFELSFKSAVQCSAYLDLQRALADGPRKALDDAYMAAFVQLEKTLRAQNAAPAPPPTTTSPPQTEGASCNDPAAEPGKDSLDSYYTSMEAQVVAIREQQTKIVEGLLSTKKWSLWKVEELRNWRSFLSSKKTKFQMRVKDMVQGILNYENTALQLEREMKRNITQKFGGEEDGNHKAMDESTRLQNFEAMFAEILSSAEQRFKPQGDNVAQWVAEAYSRVGVDREFTSNINGPSKIFADIASHLKNAFFSPDRSTCTKLEDVIGKLNLTLDTGLKDCTQYADAVVDGIIAATSTILKQGNLSKVDQLDGHRFVHGKLLEQMTNIQRRWDAQHNIAEMLKGAKPRLRNFFDGVVAGIGTTERLLRELRGLLHEEVPIKRPNVVLVRDVSGRIRGRSWALDWTKLRACLDLQLVALIDEGRTDRLLDLVCDGSKHYNEMVRTLIGAELQALYHAVRKDYMSSVRLGLQNVAHACLKRTRDQNLTAISFLEMVEKELEFSLSGHETDLSGYDPLGRYLWNHISPSYRDQANLVDMDYLVNKDHGIEQVCIKSLLEEESRKQVNLFDEPLLKRELTESVIKRLADGSQHVSIRCTAKCPLCGMQCMHELGHPISTKKHTCIHQIRGLAGTRDVKTGRLWKNTCNDDIIEKTCFKKDRKWHDAADFNRVFDDWDDPASPTKEGSLSLKLREYIFWNYQDHLCKLHECLPCLPEDKPTVPDLDELRKAIENRLSSRAEFESLYEIFKNGS